MKKILIAAFICSTFIHAQSAEERRLALERPTAKVEVVAFEASGRFLGRPKVSTFEDVGDKRNLAVRFRDGVATEIPYSVYRIETRLPGYFPDIRYVQVYQPKVTVVVGLRFGQELPQVPPRLGGRITGLNTPLEKTYVKLIGVYENVSAESAISSDGSFTLAGLAPGKFLLLVVSESGVLASRELTIPYIGPPLDVRIGDGAFPPRQ